MRQLRHLKIGALILASLVSSAGAQGQVVLPAVLAGLEGNGNNGYPFNCSGFGVPSMRYQQVYLGSEVGTGDIHELRFRQDDLCGTGFGPQVIPNVTIQLSSTTTAHPFGPSGGLSSTFVNNVGPDVTTIFAGDLVLSSIEDPATPHSFDIIVPLRQRFFFDSSTGANLLLDVRVPSGAMTTCLDAHFEADDGVARAGAFDHTSPTSDFHDTYGLVTQVVFWLFEDGFESGDTSTWSFTAP